MLREEAPTEPEDPLPRCAVAVDTSKTVAITNRVLDLPEKDIMAASIQKPTFGNNLEWYAFSCCANMNLPKEADALLADSGP
jgi:hypothetical protein